MSDDQRHPPSFTGLLCGVIVAAPAVGLWLGVGVRAFLWVVGR